MRKKHDELIIFNIYNYLIAKHVRVNESFAQWARKISFIDHETNFETEMEIFYLKKKGKFY